MILTLLLSTFTTVFLAELGDKTQIATMVMSGSSKKPLAVFIGSSTALVLATFLGALIGGSISTVIPNYAIKIVAAVGFLFIGLRLLLPQIGALRKS